MVGKTWAAVEEKRRLECILKLLSLGRQHGWVSQPAVEANRFGVVEKKPGRLRRDRP